MSKLAIGVSEREEMLQSHVSSLVSKIRGEWGSAHGFHNLEKIESASRGGLYWEIFTGEVTEKGKETMRKALNDFGFAEMEGIGLPLYILTHPAARSGIRIEIDSELIHIGGGMRDA